MDYLTRNRQETYQFGHTLAERLEPGSLAAFSGDLGAGKTTLIQGVLEALGAEKPYVSPTFVLMKQYDLIQPVRGIERVYHVDAYRVEEKDFKSLGFEEWVTDPAGIVLVEWPERIKNLLPEKRVVISLRSLSETEREIAIDSSILKP